MGTFTPNKLQLLLDVDLSGIDSLSGPITLRYDTATETWKAATDTGGGGGGDTLWAWDADVFALRPVDPDQQNIRLGTPDISAQLNSNVVRLLDAVVETATEFGSGYITVNSPDGSAGSGYDITYRVAAEPKPRVRIDGSGYASGDGSSTPEPGVIVTSPDGNTVKRIGIDNSGAIVVTDP